MLVVYYEPHKYVDVGKKTIRGPTTGNYLPEILIIELICFYKLCTIEGLFQGHELYLLAVIYYCYSKPGFTKQALTHHSTRE